MRIKKVKGKGLSALSLAVCAAFSASAFAQSPPNTVNFEGSILDVTCTPTIAGGNTVTLPPTTIATLAVAGETDGETEFIFDMTGCSVSPVRTEVWFHFGGGNVDSNGRLTPTAGTQKVRFELLDGPGGTPIVAGGTAPGPNTAPGPGQGTSVGFTGTAPNMEAHKSYAVRYYADQGLVTGDGGNVSSSAVWTSVFY